MVELHPFTYDPAYRWRCYLRAYLFDLNRVRQLWDKEALIWEWPYPDPEEPDADYRMELYTPTMGKYNGIRFWHTTEVGLYQYVIELLVDPSTKTTAWLRLSDREVFDAVRAVWRDDLEVPNDTAPDSVSNFITVL